MNSAGYLPNAAEFNRILYAALLDAESDCNLHGTDEGKVLAILVEPKKRSHSS
ncbi:hypothetical protein [Coleofasciculus sp. FACHB-129]|uniref:hypothetical protein n=1 Tax=Coleofasciculus sp. FACHB-129 TaxID=2692785 RepID=UPI001A7E3553|nr:hypothetical protein [Coleofasciculus sp. FACHB-129]